MPVPAIPVARPDERVVETARCAVADVNRIPMAVAAIAGVVCALAVHAAYSSFGRGEVARGQAIGLCVAALDGSAPCKLVAPDTGVCTLPQFSPDGTRVAYLFQTPSAPLKPSTRLNIPLSQRKSGLYRVTG